MQLPSVRTASVIVYWFIFWTYAKVAPFSKPLSNSAILETYKNIVADVPDRKTAPATHVYGILWLTNCWSLSWLSTCVLYAVILLTKKCSRQQQANTSTRVSPFDLLSIVPLCLGSVVSKLSGYKHVDVFGWIVTIRRILTVAIAASILVLFVFRESLVGGNLRSRPIWWRTLLVLGTGTAIVSFFSSQKEASLLDLVDVSMLLSTGMFDTFYIAMGLPVVENDLLQLLFWWYLVDAIVLTPVVLILAAQQEILFILAMSDASFWWNLFLLTCQGLPVKGTFVWQILQIGPMASLFSWLFINTLVKGSENDSVSMAVLRGGALLSATLWFAVRMQRRIPLAKQE